MRVLGEQSGTFVTLMPRFSLIELDQPATTLSRVNAGVLNLGHYRFHGPKGRFTLRHQNWSFKFLPVGEPTFLYPISIQNEEYFFTHHLVISQTDDTTFLCKHAHEELALLSTFLSFCHGHWVSTSLTYGLEKHGTTAMEEWGTRKVSPWKRTSNWLDEHHGEGMVELFPGFVERMSDPDWRDAIEHAIYWYIRADTSLVGADGACILLQAALERLAWHVLVRDRRSVSEDGFHKLPAADQLRLLLTIMAIPLALPEEMCDLQERAREFNWTDGPQAFVDVRNRLVHPPKKGRIEKGLPYYDAFRLAKWYVELILLKACNYSGVYSNRTRKHRAIGQVEPVPWSV
jgi:hypothetical protein